MGQCVNKDKGCFVFMICWFVKVNEKSYWVKQKEHQKSHWVKQKEHQKSNWVKQKEHQKSHWVKQKENLKSHRVKQSKVPIGEEQYKPTSSRSRTWNTLSL